MGYKDLTENYQIVVNNLAAERGEKDTNLVLNLFQSLLDEFTRGYTKNDFEPPKVGAAALGAGGSLCRHVTGEGAYPQGAPRRPGLCALSQQSKAQKKKRKQERDVSMCVLACMGVCVCVCARAHAPREACVFPPSPKGSPS